MITQGSLSAADLLTFALWLNLLQLPVRTMGFALTFVARCISSSERIFELLDAQSAVQEKPDAKPLGEVAGHVRFEKVGFGYNALSPVLQGVDIDATPGRVIALLGPAGSGKSTVVNLIPRFYDITEGRITIDGTDIRDVTLDSLRTQIGIVQQDVFLFIGTIRDNIAYGRPVAERAEVVAAATAAGADGFISHLPDGYDTVVGERGYTLSGGQRQRIAIARALLVNPPVLILDDATSAIDVTVEQRIHESLRDQMRGRTTLIVAHRLSTIGLADRVVLIEGGKVIADGTHESLLASEPRYARVLASQTQNDEVAA
jgi:ABC-type multidrug transport system fused ATPase/permease subunit